MTAMLRVLALLAFLAVASCQIDTESYSQAGLDNSTISKQLISYTDSTGASLRGYFSYDNSTTEKRGLVVIIPDWDGIGNYEKWRADLLANLGYAAFVADIYTTTVIQGPSLPQANRSMLTTTYSTNQTLFVARMNGALDTAKRQAVVDATKVAAIGYCFGGGAVMQLARSYPSPSTQGLRGVVSFHGSQLAQKAGDKNFTQGNPVVVSIQNGYVDPSNNASQLASIQAELEAALVQFQLTNYGETLHAFTEPLLPAWTPATTGSMAYSKYADIISWAHLRAFLLYVFGNTDQALNPYTGSVWDTESDALATA